MLHSYLHGLTWNTKERMPGSNIPLSLIPSHCHLANFQGWRRDPAAHVEIIADHRNIRQHLTQIPGNGDFFYRIGQGPMLDP